MPGSGTEKNYE